MNFGGWLRWTLAIVLCWVLIVGLPTLVFALDLFWWTRE